MHSNKVKEISLIGILAAVNIASRIYLQFLPNIKPVTSIIIISVMLFGLGFGVKLSVVTTVVSNLFLGMGTWTFFQILAWVVICLITQFLMDFLKKINKEPKLLPMAIFAFFMGYVFGIVVSLEQLMLGGPSLYIVYYIKLFLSCSWQFLFLFNMRTNFNESIKKGIRKNKIKTRLSSCFSF